MKNLFDLAIGYVLQNEGGYVWDKDDAGGPTNFGITQHDLAVHRGYPVSPTDVKEMPVSEAKDIYLKVFWGPLGLASVDILGVAVCILDSGVLYGAHTAAVYAQEVVNTLGGKLTVDGQIGTTSVTALNAVDVRRFVTTYVARIHARIDGVISSHPRDQKFRKGWEARANRLLILA